MFNSGVILCILTFTLSEEKIRDMIKKRDMTFAPMGSGGYSIQERKKCEFVLTEMDCSPARAHIIRVSENSIWCPLSLVSLFCSMLVQLGHDFSCKRQVFKDKEAAFEAFEKFKKEQ